VFGPADEITQSYLDLSSGIKLDELDGELGFGSSCCRLGITRRCSCGGAPTNTHAVPLQPSPALMTYQHTNTYLSIDGKTQQDTLKSSLAVINIFTNGIAHIKNSNASIEHTHSPTATANTHVPPPAAAPGAAAPPAGAAAIMGMALMSGKPNFVWKMSNAQPIVAHHQTTAANSHEHMYVSRAGTAQYD